jgi:hypothetical protein
VEMGDPRHQAIGHRRQTIGFSRKPKLVVLPWNIYVCARVGFWKPWGYEVVLPLRSES